MKFENMAKKHAFVGNDIKIFVVSCLFALGCTMAPCSSQSPEIKDRIDYAQLKAEARLRYRLPPRVKNSTEETDTRNVLNQLKLILQSKKIVDLKIVESAETKMNRKMDISDLEYSIDHLEDSVPEIREKKKQLRKAIFKKTKTESGGRINLTPTQGYRPYSY